jgi:Uncharacterized protein conserved in bacteria (DUF2252)
VFASPERRLVFDVNDFDETLPGPWEWDVKRLAVSMLIAARDNGYRARDEDRIVLDTVGRYRTAMAEFAGMSDLDVWYSRLEIESLVQELAPQFKQKMVQRTEQALAKARTKDSMAAFSKLTQSVNGEVRIVDQSPLIVPIEQLAPGREREEMSEVLHQLLRGYRETLEFDRRMLHEQFRLVDFARKVVGVGSVGTLAWIGADTAGTPGCLQHLALRLTLTRTRSGRRTRSGDPPPATCALSARSRARRGNRGGPASGLPIGLAAVERACPPHSRQQIGPSNLSRRIENAPLCAGRKRTPLWGWRRLRFDPRAGTGFQAAHSG